MKIVIIGPSGSGKSYLAQKLSDRLNIPHFDLDDILFTFSKTKRERKTLSESEFLPRITALFKNPDWIIEGLHPIDIILQEADLIIRLESSFLRCVSQQWKRYFTQPQRRRKYGLWNNLRLSRYIFRQFYEPPTEDSDPRKTWIRSLDLVLKKYEGKVFLTSGVGKSDLVSRIENMLQNKPD